MIGICAVQADKIAAIHRQDSARLAGCKRQHLSIGNALIGLPRFLHRQHIMTESAESVRNYFGKTFISIQPRHIYAASCRAIAAIISSGYVAAYSQAFTKSAAVNVG